ncbi:abortive infection system antitoxin AbiGi family protein [Pseudomonas sp. BN411]|uniref:abortive infection system antitoxin AbiGi family protein n=1 Tax=Pseudomonas sp. BN411 TaxID=2567887 RepID=UPI0024552A0E|nr:abortive infection system antitoxin AbiGi family protein [Pseudomonas sp. BN411]MDH4563693.1 hypothetical protein [Pseudomonas sp. BN411]
MAISTNSIIHYTSTYKALIGILKEGFRVKYCLERLALSENASNAAHPMVSFCDIPLSDSKQHFSAYGKYGVGLSKTWAIENGVNPVIYIDHNSLFAKSIESLIVERRRSDTNLTKEQRAEILRIKSYAKNYSGPLKRKSLDSPDYRFYDEREWRLVPSSDIIGDASFSVTSAAYMEDKDKYNSRVSHCRVKFSASDISYIIVKDTEEIPRVINFLRSVYSSKCTADELDVLFSKICSTQQIIDDY